jgi:N-acetylmuramic acid 6-phosphate etherase
MTESVDPRFQDLDAWSPARVATAIWETQLAAVAAVGPALPQIAKAIEAAAARLAGGGGRLVYAGAGTSARVAVQDGSELPPTFDWPEERLRFLIAGGERALLHAVEGAEDDRDDAVRQVRNAVLGPDDVLVAVAASGRTPFTLAALAEARVAGALTIAVSNNADAALLVGCDMPILAETGPEVVAGSTRMKAGTAQKVVLNMISTGIMIRLGRVHRGLMVDMRPLNDKLRSRAVDMVARLAAVTSEAAAQALEVVDGDIKRAVLVAGGLSSGEASQRLSSHGGNLRAALGEG